MSVMLWGMGAVVAGVVVIALGMLTICRKGPVLDEAMPATALQRLSRRGLAAGLVLGAGLVGMVLYYGPERVAEDDAVRIPFTLLLVLVLALFGFLAFRVLAWLRRGDGEMDERDRAILGGSQGLRSVGMLVTMAVWVIGLQESYNAEGVVPVYYLHLMFWSVLVVSLLAFPLGILFGYRRS